MDAQAHVVALRHALAGECSRIFCGMGLKSAWGFRSTIAALANGVSVYFAEGMTEALRTVMAYGCDYMICSVHQLRELVQAQRESLTPVPSLKAVCTGGSIIPLELVRPAQALLCSRIILIYGSSEVGHSALEIADVHKWQDGATGFVTPWTEIEAIDERRQKLPAGETGELRVRSFAQAKFGGVPTEDRRLPWFYPGDRGMVSADGRVTVTGRTVDILNIGGMKISSERIQHVLMRHPNVVDAGVIGVADSDGLTEIRAAVVVRPSVSEAELQAHVAAGQHREARRSHRLGSEHRRRHAHHPPTERESDHDPPSPEHLRNDVEHGESAHPPHCVQQRTVRKVERNEHLRDPEEQHQVLNRDGLA